MRMATTIGYRVRGFGFRVRGIRKYVNDGTSQGHYSA